MKILFLDESGDHNLSVIDPSYPLFVWIDGAAQMKRAEPRYAVNSPWTKLTADQGFCNRPFAQKAKSPDDPTEAVAPTGNPQSTCRGFYEGHDRRST
jgi:hypothetical protein